MRFFRLLLDVLHQRVLLHHDRVQVLEELLQLDHRTLDLLDRVMALLHIAQSRLGLASAVGIEQCLLEDLRVAAILCGFSDLGLAGFRVDDQVLAALLFLHFLPELALLSLIGINGLPYPAVQGIDLRLVHGLLCFALALDSFHAICEAAVSGHDVGAHGVDLLVGSAIAAHEATLHALEVGQAALEVIDGTAYGTALVVDGVGVAALGHGSRGLRVWSALVKRLHFDVVLLCCKRSQVSFAGDTRDTAGVLVNAYSSPGHMTPARSSAVRNSAAHTADRIVEGRPDSHMGFPGRSRPDNRCTAQTPCQSVYHWAPAGNSLLNEATEFCRLLAFIVIASLGQTYGHCGRLRASSGTSGGWGCVYS